VFRDGAGRPGEANMTDETIFAVASGSGRAGVAVIRASGPSAGPLIEALTRKQRPPPRCATRCRLRDPTSGETIDDGLVLWFPAPASFTGQDVAEFQVHGSRAVIRDLMRVIGEAPGMRPAAAGEFARRAFQAGKLDLAQVEALADLVDAQTSQQRRQALSGLSGTTARAVGNWRDGLLHARALIAAEIDFSDEGDVADDHAAEIDSLLLRLAEDMESAVSAARSARLIANGIRIVIAGRPNVGKSSLLNALAGTDAAIVTEYAGTTRDIVSVNLDWGGYAVSLSDTAGMRRTIDPIEAIGISRALGAVASADIVLHVDDGAGWDKDVERQISSTHLIRVRSKCDLAGVTDVPGAISVSATTGVGLDALRSRVLEMIAVIAPEGSEPVVVHERQVSALRNAAACCRRAITVPSGQIELRDHEVRMCERALLEIIGRIGVEDVLGAVFSRFCIGK
jgi:tRNA modification GTPase